MGYVTVHELLSESGEVWDRVAAGEQIVVTRDGKAFAVLLPTHPSDLNETLRVLRLRAFGRAVDALRQQARENGLESMTDEEIDAEINAVREERRARGH